MRFIYLSELSLRDQYKKQYEKRRKMKQVNQYPFQNYSKNKINLMINDS